MTRKRTEIMYYSRFRIDFSEYCRCKCGGRFVHAWKGMHCYRCLKIVLMNIHKTKTIELYRVCG
jgi:hypothetical protein